MEWISSKFPPKDNSNVLTINDKVNMLPLKAYYEHEYEEFISLENSGGTIHPISVTHWMPLPEKPCE